MQKTGDERRGDGGLYKRQRDYDGGQCMIGTASQPWAHWAIVNKTAHELFCKSSKSAKVSEGSCKSHSSLRRLLSASNQYFSECNEQEGYLHSIDHSFSFAFSLQLGAGLQESEVLRSEDRSLHKRREVWIDLNPCL